MSMGQMLLRRTAPVRGACRELLAQYPAGTACLALFATLSTALPFLRRALIDIRDLSDRFEPWRFFTGHLVHASYQHLVLNLALFVPISAWRERKVGLQRLLLELLVIAGAVALGVRWLHTGWSTYCGLSGVVYGLLAVALLGAPMKAARAWPLSRRLMIGPLIVAILAVKTTLECLQNGWIWQGKFLESTLGVVYLSGSHAAGLFAGLCVAIAWSLEARSELQARRNDPVTEPGSAASRMAPIIAAPAAPDLLSPDAALGVTPPSA